MKNSVIKRVWAWLMVACMLFTMVPAFAEADPAVEVAVEEAAAPVEEAAPEEAVPAEEVVPAEEAAPEEAPVAEPEVEPEAEDDATMLVAAAGPCPKSDDGKHEWVLESIIVKGDCTKQQVEQQKCVYCGALQRISTGVKHDFDTVDKVTPATCTTPEYTGRLCRNPLCKGNDAGNGPAEDPDHPLRVTGPALGHDWSDPVVVPATCTTPGTSTVTCKREGCDVDPDKDGPQAATEVTELPALDHTEPAPGDGLHIKQMPATCTKPAREAVLCTVCGAEIRSTPVEGSEPLGHLWEGEHDGWHFDTDSLTAGKITKKEQHWRECARGKDCDGGKDGNPYRETGSCWDLYQEETTEATCQEAAVTTYTCLVCLNQLKETKGEPDPSKHVTKQQYYDFGTTDPSQRTPGFQATAGWYDVTDANLELDCGTAVQIRRVCTICNQEVSRDTNGIIEHEWVERPDLSTGATCYSTGKQVFVCARSGHCKNYEVSADQNWTVTDVANETAYGSGLTTRVARKNIVLPKVPHNFKTTPLYQAATCTEPAYLYFECEYYTGTEEDCDVEDHAACCHEIRKYQTLEGTELGHQIPLKSNGEAEVTWITDVTCETEGRYQYECVRCGETVEETVEPLEHKWGQLVYRSADCENPDRYSRKCSECGKEDPDTLVVVPDGKPALGHNWSWWVHTSKLEADNPYKTDDEQGDIDEASSKHYKKCSLCGKEVLEACSFKDVVVEADCMNEGHKDRQCQVCDIIASRETITGDPNKDQHKWSDYLVYDDTDELDINGGKLREGYPANCQEPGYGYRVCVNCEITYDAKGEPVKGTQCTAKMPIEVEPAHHTWVRIDQNKVAAGDKDGVKDQVDSQTPCLDTVEWYVCVKCTANTKGDGDLKYAPKMDADHPITYDGVKHWAKPVTKDATKNHYFKERVVQEDCTEDAQIVYKCEWCGKIDNKEHPPKVIPGTKTEHSWGEWEITDANKPTCYKTGYGTRKCQRCGKEDPNHTIPKLAHTPSSNTRLRPADCLFPDRYVIYCTVCNADLSEYQEATDGTPATGHKFTGVWVPDGKGYHTRVCLNTNCPSMVEINATTHEKAVRAKCDYVSDPLPATCKDPARTVKTCKLCGDIVIEKTGTEIDKDGHKFVVMKLTNGSDSLGATCTKPGVGIRTCVYCGATDGYAVMPAGHTYNEGVVTKEPTCTEAGVMTFTCTRGENCSEYDKKTGIAAQYTEPIDKLEHQYDLKTEIKQATCSEEGTTIETCIFCGDTRTVTTEKTPHSFGKQIEDDSDVAWIEVCSKCGECKFVAWKEGITAEQKNCENVKHNTWTKEHDTEEREAIQPEGKTPGHEAGVWCKDCERYISGGEEIPPEAEHTTHHFVSDWDDDQTCLIEYCDVCGEIKQPLSADAWMDTPADKRNCLNVKHTFEGKVFQVTQHGDTEVVKGKDPEVGVPGWTDGERCTVCGQFTKEQQMIDPLDPPAPTYPISATANRTAVLRDKPNGALKKVVTSGTAVEITGDLVDDHYPVELEDGTTGYIHSSCLTIA